MDFNMYIMKKMESKLIELMGKEEYTKFAAEIAQEGFQEEVIKMADSEFKDFIVENFDEITKS